MKITPLFEDNLIIVIEKPSGILSQGDYTGNETIIDVVKNYIKEKYNKQGNVFIGVIHRLDRQVSGVIVFAKNTKAASRLSEQMRNKNFIKFYIAVTSHIEGNNLNWIKINNYIRREKNISYCSDKKKHDSQNASLQYKKIADSGDYSLLLICLETGRKHQIRATFSSLRCPVAGDRLYGSNLAFKKDAIALHSCFLKFLHPTKQDYVEVFTINPEFNKFFEMKNFEDIIKSEINEFIIEKDK